MSTFLPVTDIREVTRHAIAAAVAPLYLVESATPGEFVFSESPDGTTAYIAETATPGEYAPTLTPGAASVANIAIVGTTGIVY